MVKLEGARDGRKQGLSGASRASSSSSTELLQQSFVRETTEHALDVVQDRLLCGGRDLPADRVGYRTGDVLAVAVGPNDRGREVEDVGPVVRGVEQHPLVAHPAQRDIFAGRREHLGNGGNHRS